MDNDNEFKTIYEDLKKESLKDQEKKLEKELESKVPLIDNDIKTINEFLKDYECVENLNNFISAFNRQNLINSELYQKNKGLYYFKEFMSFKNFLFKTQKNPKEQNDFITIFDSIELIPEKNKIQNLFKNNSSSTKSQDSNQIKKNPNSMELNSSLNNSTDNLTKSQKGKQKKSDSEINLSSFKDSKEKKKINLDLENIEISNGISYECNAIDFIKYALCFSFLENEVATPESISTKFDKKLLEKARAANLDIIKKSVKFDLIIKNMSKEDIITFFNILKNNVFQKEKLYLDLDNNHRFDLLIGVIKNYLYQSQDKYSQISAYILIIKILNYLKSLNENDKNYLEYKNLNKEICSKLNINEQNEKVLILITNGSYHLLSQIIKFSNKNIFQDIERREIKKEKFYSFDYENNTDKILSDLVEGTPIHRIFSLIKNNINIPNLSKFLNILSELEKSKIKYSIIYFEDDIKISLGK